MHTTLKNNQLTVTADTRGGELLSVVAHDGMSYLWDGNPAYWNFRAPTLFPIVGSLRKGFAQSAAGEVHLPQHGFCRRAEFLLEQGTCTSVSFLLESSEETRAAYPYDFSFRIGYTLEEASVTTTYTVRNTGNSVMPFCVGGHPGFHVPLSEGDCFEDYLVEFEKPETTDCPQVNMQESLIIDTVRNRVLTNTAAFSLNHVLFRGDAIIFDRLQSRSVKLYSRNTGRGVQMDFADMDYFAVWSPITDAPFVCFEPWTGLPTQESEDDVLEHKQGMTLLQPGEEKKVSFKLTLF